MLVQMIPRFTEEGLLPPGGHGTDLEELKEKMGWGRRGKGVATKLGSGQPFLRFFQTDREGRERGVLSVQLRATR